ncbi:MAG: sugar phosphate isomerase/epimerase [Kiritimatiellaeota bacterium]|nr:sugar phosphate isomerase/epimerase [Kiritimatiellota bacterium]
MPKITNPRVSAQLYTLHEHLKTPADIAATLKRLHEIGYRYVQISAVGPIDPQELKRIMDAAGITPIGYHLAMKDLREDFNKTVAKLHTWGVEYAAVASLPPEDCVNEAGYVASAKEMNAFGKRLVTEGIRLQYHNHNFELMKFGGRTGLEIIYAESDPRYLQAEIDTAWIARGAMNPVDWIMRVKGRMDQVHFKDTVVGSDRNFVFAEIGEGNLNWPAIIKACVGTGVRDYHIEQDACPATNDPFKSLAISLANLIKLGLIKA